MIHIEYPRHPQPVVLALAAKVLDRLDYVQALHSRDYHIINLDLPIESTELANIKCPARTTFDSGVKNEPEKVTFARIVPSLVSRFPPSIRR